MATSSSRPRLGDLVSKAFYINADASLTRRGLVEATLRGTVPFERWPAVQGGPHLLRTHGAYLSQGVEEHLLSPRCRQIRGKSKRARAPNCSLANVSGWGMVGNYLSHVTLLEHVRATSLPDDGVLILQDDVALRDQWAEQLVTALTPIRHRWRRVLLAWFGAERLEDCNERLCIVRGPAGPDEHGRRYYHGLQAQVVRAKGAACLLHRIRGVRIKSIDSLLVNANCSGTFALRKHSMLGAHARGSERVALDRGLRGA